MQSQSRFLDDLAQLMTSAMGVAQGARQEAESVLKNRFERIMGDYDFVAREEFDVVQEMATRARQENESLKARTNELETELESVKQELTALKSDTAYRNQRSVEQRHGVGGSKETTKPAKKKVVKNKKRY